MASSRSSKGASRHWICDDQSHLSGPSLSECDRTGAESPGALIAGISICDSDLSRTDLTNANMWDVELVNTNLSLADLNGGQHRRHSLVPCDLPGWHPQVTTIGATAAITSSTAEWLCIAANSELQRTQMSPITLTAIHPSFVATSVARPATACHRLALVVATEAILAPQGDSERGPSSTAGASPQISCDFQRLCYDSAHGTSE